MNGVINVYKEAGFTSHDVVAKLRGILQQKKIGHTGTLDPDATGVLPICLGKATKLCDMLTDEKKTYEACLLLGRETDTQDISGEVIAENEVRVSEAEAEQVILSFLGEQMQIPPMYSALKVNGKKLYELAREGKTIERKARKIHIYEITILKFALPEIYIRVTCSKGTYIRTICHDIGKKLMCGGCMKELTRTEVGRFKLTDSFKLREIETARDQGKLESVIVPIDQMFDQFKKGIIQDKVRHPVYNGNPFPVKYSDLDPGSLQDGDSLRIYDSDEDFIGIYRFNKQTEECRLKKMFRDGSSKR